MTESVSAVAARTKHPSESILYAIDFTALLSSGETLSGTPTVTGSPSGLTIGTPAVNTATLVDDEGNTVAIGKAVQVRISAGTAGIDYVLTVSCATTGSDTRVGVCKLYVRSS